MPTRMKHVAIVSQNHSLVGQFYQTLFGMTGDGRSEGAVSLTDGYVGLNVNSRAPGRQAGLDHFGFEVDDVEAIFARAQDDFPDVHWLKRPSNRPFAGISMHDPAGNVFDLSQAGMENRRGIYADASEQVHPRHIDHLCLRTVSPDLMARFYVDVFGLAERERPAGDPNYYLTDGQMTLVVAPWQIADYAGSGIERPGCDHLGFVVEDLDVFRADLAALIEKNPALAPKPKKGDEAEVRVKLLSQCHYGEVQLCDPDGVLLDVHTS